MTCKECRKAKRFAPGSMYCLLYGIIIREDHEGNLKGCEDDDGDPDLRGKGTDGTEIQGQRGNAADELPGVLQGTGERGSIPGMEETEEGWWY